MKEGKSRMVKCYRVVMDGFYSSIEEYMMYKHQIDNEYTYFKSLSAAKRHLISQLKDIADQYKANIKEIKSIKAIENREYIRK